MSFLTMFCQKRVLSLSFLSFIMTVRLGIGRSQLKGKRASYSKRFGIIIGPVESQVHVEMLKSLKKTDEGAFVKDFVLNPDAESSFASQLIIDEVISEDQRFIEKAAVSIKEEYPVGSRAFFLGDFNYGRPLEVTAHEDNKAEIWLSTVTGREPEFGHEIVSGIHHILLRTPWRAGSSFILLFLAS